MSRFRDETRHRGERFVWSAVLFIIAFCCGFCGVLCKATAHSGGMVWLLCCVVGILCATLLICRVPRGEAYLAGELCDLRAIGALIERLELSFGGERRQVVSLLADLLRRVQESDRDRFISVYRARLNEALRMPDFARDADLMEAILRAYERVGDAEALALVEALASHPGETGAERRVRDAARTCRTGLRERVERLRTGADLLRPSGEPGTAETLLRPASETSRASSSELLRVGEIVNGHGNGNGQA